MMRPSPQTPCLTQVIPSRPHIKLTLNPTTLIVASVRTHTKYQSWKRSHPLFSRTIATMSLKKASLQTSAPSQVLLAPTTKPLINRLQLLCRRRSRAATLRGITGWLRDLMVKTRPCHNQQSSPTSDSQSQPRTRKDKSSITLLRHLVLKRSLHTHDITPSIMGSPPQKMLPLQSIKCLLAHRKSSSSVYRKTLIRWPSLGRSMGSLSSHAAMVLQKISRRATRAGDRLSQQAGKTSTRNARKKPESQPSRRPRKKWLRKKCLRIIMTKKTLLTNPWSVAAARLAALTPMTAQSEKWTASLAVVSPATKRTSFKWLVSSTKKSTRSCWAIRP